MVRIGWLLSGAVVLGSTDSGNDYVGRKDLDYMTIHKVQRTDRFVYMWGSFAPKNESKMPRPSNTYFVFPDEKSRPERYEGNREENIGDDLTAFCQQKNMVTWATKVGDLASVVLDSMGEETHMYEWYPSRCTLPEPERPKFACKPRGPFEDNCKMDPCKAPFRVDDDHCFPPEAFSFMVPEVLWHDYGTDEYVLFKTQVKFTGDDEDSSPLENLICKDNYNFSGQPKYSGPWAATKGSNETKGKLGEGIVPDKVLRYFREGLDVCTLIRHPCHCQHAAEKWGCSLCRTAIGNFPLCYTPGTETEAWCTAITGEGDGGSLLIPIQPEEYEKRLQDRDAYPRTIWLDM